jgi:hypothetical protein
MVGKIRGFHRTPGVGYFLKSETNRLIRIVSNIEIMSDDVRGIRQVKFSREMRISPGNLPVGRLNLDNR